MASYPSVQPSFYVCPMNPATHAQFLTYMHNHPGEEFWCTNETSYISSRSCNPGDILLCVRCQNPRSSEQTTNPPVIVGSLKIVDTNVTHRPSVRIYQDEKYNQYGIRVCDYVQHDMAVIGVMKMNPLLRNTRVLTELNPNLNEERRNLVNAILRERHDSVLWSPIILDQSGEEDFECEMKKNKQLERIVQWVEAWRQLRQGNKRVTIEYEVTCPMSATKKRIDIHAEGGDLAPHSVYCTEVKTGDNAAGFSHALGEVQEKCLVMAQNRPNVNAVKQVCLFYELPARENGRVAVIETKRKELYARKQNALALGVTVLPSYKVSVEWDGGNRPIRNDWFRVYNFDVNELGQEVLCNEVDMSGIDQWPNKVCWQASQL